MSKKKKNLKSKIAVPASLPGLNISPFNLNIYHTCFPSRFSGKSNLSFADLQIMLKLKNSSFDFDTETGLDAHELLRINAQKNANAEKKEIIKVIGLEHDLENNISKKKRL